MTPSTALCASSVSQNVDAAESQLLSQLSGAPYEKRAVRLPSSGHTINTLSAGEPGRPVLVLVHGWGAGVAFFGRNLRGLSASFRVHFVDWLGFGASSRPHFSTSLTPEEAESFFLDAFEEWATQMQLLESSLSSTRSFFPFHLTGHSLGAYLSVCFALRRPDLVRSLILASPVGVPRRPPVATGAASNAPLVHRFLRWIVFALWDRGATPQLIIRLGGRSLGRAFAERLVRPRFPASSESTLNALIEYFYQISAAPASGEHSLSTILQSGAYARRPLCDRLPHVTQQVTFLYGDRDWMDCKTAHALQGSLKKRATIVVLENAGHHLYYDRPDEFNRLVLHACLAAEDAERPG